MYEYKVVAAPKKGTRLKGVKGTADRFALTLMALMNDLGRDGWEYLRAETLPVETRSGLTGITTSFQNMLVFRRGRISAAENLQLQASDLDPEATEEAAPRLSLTPADLVPESTAPQLSAVPDEDGRRVPDLGPARSSNTP